MSAMARAGRPAPDGALWEFLELPAGLDMVRLPCASLAQVRPSPLTAAGGLAPSPDSRRSCAQRRKRGRETREAEVRVLVPRRNRVTSRVIRDQRGAVLSCGAARPHSTLGRERGGTCSRRAGRDARNLLCSHQPKGAPAAAFRRENQLLGDGSGSPVTRESLGRRPAAKTCATQKM